MTVIKLDDRRNRQEPESYDGAVCICGEAWFELKGEYTAVCLSRTGDVTGYAGYFFCVSCGRPWSWGPDAG